ncbi:MAG TPA: hypothetical protein VM942_09915 [Acidimicrobiales bacterium]|nr:hypothetical protein [Acidimicrobiales bacterium]
MFVDEDEARAVTAGEAPAFDELWWGKRLAGVRVHLPSLGTAHLVRELLEDSWRRKAPKRVVAAFDADRE